MKHPYPAHRLRAAALAAAILGASFSSTYAQQKKDNSILSIERNSIDGSPKSITFSRSATWSGDQAQEIFGHYLGMKQGGDIAMRRKYSTTTPAKVTSDRYQEYYKGVRVEYGSFTLAIRNNRVDFITGNYYNFADAPSAAPVLAASAAFGKAIAFVGAEKYKWQDAGEEAFISARYHKDTTYKPAGELVWVEDYISNADDRRMHLAWMFDIYAQKPVSRQQVFVDATTGKILFSNSLLKHTAASGHSMYSGVIPFVTAHVGTSYWMYDSTRGDGVHTMNMHNGTDYSAATEFTSAANTWPSSTADTQALDAHWGAEMVYDYWLSQQGRHSWDDLNGILTQYVHYENGLDNANWDGAEMNYGDGTGIAAGGFSPLTSLDVTGHEIGHGVCQATANLIYEKESGAMNEGFSDCWGATIENWANPHEVDAVPKQPWKIGEEIGAGPLRSMDTPKLQTQPDTYGGTYWYAITGCTPGGGNDECGVHTNSGVLNHWYYLVTMGGTGTNDIGSSFTVNPIGWSEAANILYQTELVLASNATYADCRTATINVATTLYGACSAEVQSVTSAWYAVGVGANFVPCTAQLGYETPLLHVSEKASVTTCPASKTVSIGIKPAGPAITGGNPTVTIAVDPASTAIAGVNYTITPSSTTFTAGDMSTHYVTLTIFDNGAVNDNKMLKLGLTLAPAGSSATLSPTADSMTIYLDNDDSAALTGGNEYHTLNIGTAVTSNLTSAFYASNRRARSQFILSASEMTAAGVRPGVPISQIGFFVTTKSSTVPFANYTISMANTTAADVSTAFVTAGLVQVYTGNHTTNTGLDTLDFNTATFTWDGTSNVMVQACFGQNTAAAAANDQMMGISPGSALICDHNSTNTGTGTGCTLGYSTGGQSNARPVMRFRQAVPPARIATVLGQNHTWDVHAGQEVYFYNTADTSLVATLKNETNDLGCVSATIAAAGTGFTPAVFSAVNRSKKEIVITPAINGSSTTYDVIIYLTNTELGGVDPSTLFLLKTDEPTDATINSTNSVLLTPTLITGTNYVGFKGTFTGFSRFFLTDGPLCNTPPATITAAGSTTFCLGSNVVLNANTGTGLTYQWQVGGGSISGATSSSYTATAGGTYNVIVYRGACDSVSLPVTITVDSAHAEPITGTAAICDGQTVTLADATTGGVWSSSNPAVASVGTAGNVTGNAGGMAIIFYSVTNICGTAVATLSVTVSTPAVVAPMTGAPVIICPGHTATLADATTGGTWSSSNTSVATVGTSGIATGVGAGTAVISYNVTNVSGCITSVTGTVTVSAGPVATITPLGPVAFCTGGTVVLQGTAGAGYTYQWQVGGSDIPGATSSAYTASASGDYTVIIHNAAGCTDTSPAITVTVDASIIIVPSISITASPGTILCSAPVPVTFTANPVNGGSAPLFQWAVNGSPVSTATTYTYTPSNGDIVTITMTSNAPCATPAVVAASDTMIISPLVAPSVSITASPNDTVCAGELVTFAAVPVNGGTDPSYLWTENGTNVATGPYYLYTPSDGDILVVTMTSNYPCLSSTVAVSTPFAIHVEVPTVNVVNVTVSGTSITAGQTDTFVASSAHGGTSPAYQWYINGMPVAGATNATYITDSLQNGQIVTCAITSSELCAAPHTAMSGGVTVMVTTGVNGVTEGDVFLLLPNPNKGTFTLRGSLAATDNKVQIAVTNMLGQQIFAQQVAGQNGEVNAHIAVPETVASGMYLVTVTSGEYHQVFHMVVDK